MNLIVSLQKMIYCSGSIFMFDGTVGENKYGPGPKERDELAKVEKRC